jgi:peptidoglycan/LPS O-acetylase OafA/YrhL
MGHRPQGNRPQDSRLAALDALRGVAALAVVLFHVCIPLGVVAAPNGYLAVDFFFLLSGYVLAHVYDARLKTASMKAGAFMRERVARLYPLAFLGVLMGVGGAAIRYAPWLHDQGAAQFAATAAANLLVLPLGRLSFASDHPLFAFNAPVWSLFWEFVVNGVYGAIAPLLNGKVLAAVLAASGAALVAISLHHGSLQAGAEASTFGAGAARVGYSFFCGVAMQRVAKPHPDQRRHPGPILAVGLLALILLAPVVIASRIFDPAIVIVAFPAVLFLALQGEPQGAMRRFGLFAGDVSYPLYVTHFPIMQLFLHALGPNKPTGVTLALVLAGELTTIVAVAVIVLLFFDRPVRAWLHRRRKAARDAPTVQPPEPAYRNRPRSHRPPSPSGPRGVHGR